MDIESYILNNLDSGVIYSISIIAVSDHLPSAVVGPVRPSVLTFCITVHLIYKTLYLVASRNIITRMIKDTAVEVIGMLQKL